jgi:hypothetical protein
MVGTGLASSLSGTGWQAGQDAGSDREVLPRACSGYVWDNRLTEGEMDGSIELMVIGYGTWIMVGVAALFWVRREKLEAYLPEPLRHMLGVTRDGDPTQNA